jgi:predicted PurR-regulated permease PerM
MVWYMAVEIEDSHTEPHQALSATDSSGLQSLRWLALLAGAALIVYLMWRILAPFLAALCWAFALALIAEPIHAWLVRRSLPRSVSALIIIFLVLAVVIGPGTVVVRALAREASAIVSQVTTDAGSTTVQERIESSRVAGPALRWLDARFDLPREAIQLARSVAGWASLTLSGFITGSMWLLTQIAVTVFVLFYFLRDAQTILNIVRSLVPLPSSAVDVMFSRIAQTIRVSLGGKVVVASIQGALGGLMFFWLGLPAAVFWGTVMAVLSIFPVIGAFIVWFPAALIFAFQGDWIRALILAGWGVLIIHPVDNLLGPVLVGAALRLHTLLMFFSIIGGIAAFGAPGVVLGPVIVAVVVALFELKETGNRNLTLVRGLP